MNRRQLATAMVAGGATLTLGQRMVRQPAALAGGWASLELINPLRVVVVGVPTVIDAQMLRHGVNPDASLPGAIQFFDEAHEEAQIVQLEVISEELAILRGEVTLDQPGTYRMQTWEMGPAIELGSVQAVAPGSGEVISSLSGTPDTAVACANDDVANAVTTDILDGAFAEPLLEVPVGTMVTWTNTSAVPHQVVFDAREIEGSLMLRQEDTFSVTFSEPGDFTYHCAPHPYMKGVVRVE